MPDSNPRSCRYRIAMVSDWYYPRVGGIEYAIDALARHLQGLGHELRVFSRRYPGAAAEEQTGGLAIARLACPGLGDRCLSPASVAALKQHLKAGGYDVVHAHGLDSPLAWAALRIARRAGIPAVMTSHSLLGARALRVLLRPVLAPLLGQTRTVIGVSRAVALEARALGAAQTIHIPNGVDGHSPNGALSPLALERSGRTVIATVARMHRRKRVDECVDVAIGLLAGDRKLLFVMVGGGPLLQPLRRKVAALGLAEHFVFTGNVSRATVLHLLSQSDIFVSPSPREAFGIAVLEAFQQRVPVVARASSGVAELVEHGRTGLLAGDAAGLQAAIAALIAQPQERERLAGAAHRELQRYSWPEIAEKTEQVYARAIAETRGLDG
ncbi:MAG: glycosyltransferase family 4 protein [Gammaproteobacteria bacterium]